MRALVIQTAFLGDIVLTMPMIQVLRAGIRNVEVDVITTPVGTQVLSGNPDIRRVILYDKKGSDRSVLAGVRIAASLRAERYDIVLSPHRSLRSALLAWRAGAATRIGFDRSAGRMFFTDLVRYDPDIHEADRNLRLLGPLNIPLGEKPRPHLVPSSTDRESVDVFIRSNGMNDKPIVALAPGSAWYTKRWPEGRYAVLARLLCQDGNGVVLIGGAEDEILCNSIQKESTSGSVVSAAGRLSILQSAELIRRSKCLVTNDSAPLHLGVAMGTPVVAVFGATVPKFGFAPYGYEDVVVETLGLSCRPCAIHGGNRCPINTLECLQRITAEQVKQLVNRRIGR